ncbi:SLC13 family permease [Tolumonas osonensis]|uniref:Sodium-dependent dicarboxylate transporter 2/3/5 n=1 Tax=Tolumonas osonensis TaxID=675874 RepID=A0A841G9F0_9GAMM|nr:DASS family sodium-coupled anion symporter [Tolumonas osonensis]MBB6054559.1 sodium-dependent dicarboxylate transporter 2/3/5 [Tolumonas osonensis]
MSDDTSTTGLFKSQYKPLILLLDVALLLILLNWLPFDPRINKGLSLFLFIAVLWLSEAIHVTVTALLVPIMAVLLGIFPLQPAISHFANPTIYLFFGGFALAAALHKQLLDQFLARQILILARGRLDMAVGLLFAITALLSMWISNTATAAMMLPLAIGIASQLGDEKKHNTQTFILLGMAYSASIGGIGTLVGSPPNVIAAAQAHISFLQWLMFGIPIVLILLPCAMLALYLVLRPHLNQHCTMQQMELVWTRQHKLTLVIFSGTVLAWIGSQPISAWLGGIEQIDTLIALAAAVMICITGVASWRDVERHTEWGVLMLFGGGLSLSAILKETGTSLFLAQQITTWFSHTHPLLLLLAIATFVVFLTELASNTATAALMVPLFASVAGNMGMSVSIMSIMIAISASCAFMLPVATPPNAIVYASGYVLQRDMIRVGFVLNIMCAILLALFAYSGGI